MTPGERVKAARRRRGLTIAQAAGLCGRSEGWLKKIESGERGLPRLPDLVRLCDILGVDNLTDLTGDTTTATLTALNRPTHPTLPAIRAAMTNYRLDTNNPAQTVQVIRNRIDQAWRTWHTSSTQRSDIGSLLPDLILAAQRTAHAHTGGHHHTHAYTALADTYHLAQQMLVWLSEPELVWLAADRGMAAARTSGDRETEAGAAWCVANLLRAIGRGDEAQDVVLEAAATLNNETAPRPVALRGALKLHAGLTAARDLSYGDAWRNWDNAATDAARLGGYHHPWTVFGVANLQVHAVSIEVELGRHREATDRVEHLDLDTVPSTERRSRALIEAARAYATQREDLAALHLLQRATQESVETVRYAAPVRFLLPVMINRAGATTRTELTDLAHRLQIPTTQDQ